MFRHHLQNRLAYRGIVVAHVLSFSSQINNEQPVSYILQPEPHRSLGLCHSSVSAYFWNLLVPYADGSLEADGACNHYFSTCLCSTHIYIYTPRIFMYITIHVHLCTLYKCVTMQANFHLLTFKVTETGCSCPFA